MTYYLREKDDLVLFSDRQIESKQQGLKDLYQIYQNGDIQFTLPDELFENDLDKYLNELIDLSEFIKEDDSKIDTYLK